MTLLEVENLSTHFRHRDQVVRAVDDVSFHVDAGEVLGIVGESGCGKTMTGLSIMRLLPRGAQVEGGSIKIDGKDLSTLSERRMCDVRGNDIGMVFQDPISSLNPTKRIGDQVTEALTLHKGIRGDKAKSVAIQALKRVGFPSAEQRFGEYPHQLSGGMRQRVMIATALACEPKLLIADEPTTALDPTIGAQIIGLLDRLRKELGMALILITHDLGVVAGLADRVAVMYAGKIVECGSTTSMFRGHRHPYTRALLDAIPRLDGPVGKRLRAIPGAPPDLGALPDGCRFHARCPQGQPSCTAAEPTLSQEVPGQTEFACFFPLEAKRAEPLARASVPEPPSSPAPATVPAGAESEPTDRTILLSVKDLVKTYEVGSSLFSVRRRDLVQAVSSVSFQLEKGETLGLVGESGCGKSTTGRLIVGAERPTSGEVVFEGTDLANKSRGRPPWRRDLQMVFQDPYSSLDPRMPVGDIIAEPLLIHAVGNGTTRGERILELLDIVGLPSQAGRRYPHEFSGGQRQRIALARSLSLNPKLIVADEPVSALDVSIRAQIVNLMTDLQQEFGISYVMISHDVAVVRHFADRVAVMYLGKLVELGPTADVIARPAHPYTEMLVRTIPVPDPAIERAKPRLLVSDDVPSAANPPSGCRFHPRCPRSQDICAAVEPVMTAFGDGRSTACHFPLEAAGPFPPMSGTTLPMAEGPAAA